MPKLLGTYERELHEVVRAVVAWQPDMVVDIGAAEGYYAVGFARCLPSSFVVGFEAEETARRQMVQLVAINDCSNLRIKPLATTSSLDQALPPSLRRGKIAVVCDCEGAEMDLLQPEVVTWLKNAFVICELHEFLRPGVEDVVAERFAATHRVEILPAQPRHRGDLPQGLKWMCFLPDYWVRMVVGEDRPAGMKWLVAEPLNP